MNTITLTSDLVLYAILAGLLGAGAMWAGMRLIERAGPPTGGMVVAVGSLLTRSREKALPMGIAVYLFSAVVFGLLYTVLMQLVGLTAWPQAFFAGAGFGFFHGLVVSLALTWIVSDNHPLTEFRKATPLVFLSHFAGHIVFGAVVGLVISIAPL
ncbi:hypothetical protein [Rariglobus hedericola]|uniref:DUF1440 domain-containing protein n=1 Tax=Rariglobus hedericola TaxID=2597822 RepID=A0A556QS81_9BACT|nr:hypothetical protein [Rariglobus hedericola]TSJ79491.1 hypothetical protein FPL22_09445 [Rariglobus hedericola]